MKTAIDEWLDSEEVTLQERRQRWKAMRDMALPLVQKAIGFEGRADIDTDLNLRIVGDKHTLAEMVRALRTRGWSTTEAPPMKGSNQWTAWYSHDNCDTRIFLIFTSKVCRRVQVGTKMVEQAVYETICDEITLPEMSAA